VYVFPELIRFVPKAGQQRQELRVGDLKGADLTAVMRFACHVNNLTMHIQNSKRKRARCLCEQHLAHSAVPVLLQLFVQH
jgi:hypothetical protein